MCVRVRVCVCVCVCSASSGVRQGDREREREAGFGEHDAWDKLQVMGKVGVLQEPESLTQLCTFELVPFQD